MKRNLPKETKPRKVVKKLAQNQRQAPDSQEIYSLVGLFSGGRYEEAEPRAKMMTEVFPHHAFGWKLLGAIFKQQGRNAEALASMQRAVDLSPDDAEAHNNLGTVLRDLGQPDAAIVSYRQALAVNPDFAAAYNNLGATLNQLGQPNEALTCCRQALQINPDYAAAHNNMGNAQKALMQLDDAVASYRRVLEIMPEFIPALTNLAATLRDLGQLAAAAASYRRVLEINPNFAPAHNNLGTTLRDLGQFDTAAASYRRALEIDPHSAIVHNNMGNMLRDLGQLNAAVASYNLALEINPEFAEAHNNRGTTLQELGQLNASVVSYRRALEINPNYAAAHNNLGNALKDLGQPDAAVVSYRSALDINPNYAEAHSNLLFTPNYQPGQSAAMLLTEAQRYGDLVLRRARPYSVWHNTPDPGKNLRVGLVSGDLRQHPVGNFLEGALSALASHAAGRLELFGYSNAFQTDAVTERIKASCRGWHSAVGMSDEGLARRIHDDRIDILIDLSGHTSHNRLPMFAWKPAPVQITWLGYAGTTGVNAIDYLIADHWTLPAAEEKYFSEKILRLPETLLCFTPPGVELQVGPLPAKVNGYVTFGSFNNLSKINDKVIGLWARVLEAVPNSRLMLKTKQLNEASIRQFMVEKFTSRGISAERLILTPPVPRAEYLLPYREVDIALDTFPYTGVTTSIETLWMGVPILSLVGDRFISHFGESILQNAGLPEWIAADPDEYVSKAMQHASDLAQLAALRGRLRAQVLASPLFDAPRFARNFEQALRSVWIQWCNKQRGSQ